MTTVFDTFNVDMYVRNCQRVGFLKQCRVAAFVPHRIQTMPLGLIRHHNNMLTCEVLNANIHVAGNWEKPKCEKLRSSRR